MAGQTWWLISVIPALRRLYQESHYEWKARLGSVARIKPVKATQESPVTKEKEERRRREYVGENNQNEVGMKQVIWKPTTAEAFKTHTGMKGI